MATSFETDAHVTPVEVTLPLTQDALDASTRVQTSQQGNNNLVVFERGQQAVATTPVGCL